MNLFNLGIDFLATKISLSILLFASILNFKSLFTLKYHARYILPILVYFILLTVRSYINSTPTSSEYFDVLFFINIVIFIILINSVGIRSENLLKGSFVFAISNLVLTLFYFLNISVSDNDVDGRDTIFGMNQNFLGVSLCIAFFVILSNIFENKLNFSKKRNLLLFALPFLFFFIIKTGSRVSLISLILGITAFVFFNKKFTVKQKTISFFVFIVLALLSWFFFLKNSLVVERLMDTINDGDLANRDMIWDILIANFSDTFLWGVGKTGFVSIVGDASPHNVLLEVFLYTGLVGVFVFLIFYVIVFNRAFRRRKLENSLLPLTCMLPITGIILSGQIFDQKLIWVILATVVSSHSSKRSPSESAVASDSFKADSQ